MTWLAVGTVALVVLAALLWGARKGGKDAVKADIGEANAKAAERIAQAVSGAPTTKSAVLDRLRDPKREL